LEEAIVLLERYYCARPERQDAVLFGLFLKEKPGVFKGSTYVFLHRPVSGGLWDFVTVFTRVKSGWSVIVYENKKGNYEPTFSRDNLLIALYDN
jgi:hypothetical protein